MKRDFENKVALVTGGASGIGASTALAFALRGAKVVVADLTEGPDETTVQIIKAARGEAIFVPCDVSREANVMNVIDKTLSNFGRLDFAFNNAGIEGISAVTQDCSVENWERTIAVNLTGVWLCMKHELPHMVKQGKGVIVNCSSVAGLIGLPGSPAYVASKHGVVGLTKTAALENARSGVRVNAVCPGVIHTPMVERVVANDGMTEKRLMEMEPVGRMGEASEVADVVMWLCSDEASFVTGQAIAVDGGWTAG
ncbi:MAG: SDR family oxidoreductase [Bacteroidetes bacterium]|nr:SDR family oxidoreductase [Bacteroidota bacterium]